MPFGMPPGTVTPVLDWLVFNNAGLYVTPQWGLLSLLCTNTISTVSTDLDSFIAVGIALLMVSAIFQFLPCLKRLVGLHIRVISPCQQCIPSTRSMSVLQQYRAALHLVTKQTHSLRNPL